MQKLLIFAGPNGSGKSTLTKGIDIFGEYINADDIKKFFNCSDKQAADIAEKTRNWYLENGRDFTFETVLSTVRNIELMKKAKSKGYYIVCMYVLTCDPKINIERVKMRFLAGGHNVPEDKIKQRYNRALNLLPELFNICDEVYIFDNSCEDFNDSSIILKSVNGNIEIYPNKIWSEDMIKSLLCGTYIEEYISNDLNK